jgi:hypothetical protein
MGYEALYDEDATQAEQIATYQALIDSGDAWRLEGHIGRTAMGLIEAGLCVLGEQGHRDYWGNYVPSRYEVEPGTKGSIEYADQMGNYRDAG